MHRGGASPLFVRAKAVTRENGFEVLLIIIVRALEPKVFDAVFACAEPLFSEPPDDLALCLRPTTITSVTVFPDCSLPQPGQQMDKKGVTSATERPRRGQTRERSATSQRTPGRPFATWRVGGYFHHGGEPGVDRPSAGFPCTGLGVGAPVSP